MTKEDILEGKITAPPKLIALASEYRKANALSGKFIAAAILFCLFGFYQMLFVVGPHTGSPGFVVVPLVVALVLILFSAASVEVPRGKFEKAFENYLKAFQVLRVNPDLFVKEQWVIQETKAATRLKIFGLRWYEAEQAHPKEMDHVDRLDAKDAFEEAYEVFRDAGFIEDVGYGVFIPKS